MELFSQNLTFNETTQKQKAVRFGTVQFIPNDQYNNSIINDEKIQPLDLDEMVDVDTETTVDPFLLITKNEEHSIKIEEQLVKFR